jgi:hypothetical protein
MHVRYCHHHGLLYYMTVGVVVFSMEVVSFLFEFVVWMAVAVMAVLGFMLFGPSLVRRRR